MKHVLALGSAALLAVGAAGRARAQAPDDGFWDGAGVDVTALNFYYNRDFRSGEGQGKRAEWAQGFVVDAKSGYTRGPVGAGLDLLGIGDFKLDGVRAEGGTGLLPNNDDGTAQHALMRVAPTLKLRASQTELKWGSFIPNEPLVRASITRIMPETFQGVTLESKDVPKLDLLLARFTSAWYRDGDSRVPITLTNKNRRFLGTPDADALNLVSATYSVAPGTQLRYQGALMEDIYRQQLYNLIQTHAFGKDQLRVDLRYFRTDDVGQSRAGQSTTACSAAWCPGALAGMNSEPAINACPAPAPCPGQAVPTAMSSIGPSSTTFSNAASAAGSCVTASMARASASPGSASWRATSTAMTRGLRPMQAKAASGRVTCSLPTGFRARVSSVSA